MIKPVYAQSETQKIANRWVIGAGVNLRAEANLNAPVLTRMALNTPVNLIAAIPNSKYCEVELITSEQLVQRGFTACEFLGTNVIKPREVANAYLSDGKTPNPNYNPERTFWLKPSYEALAEYGRYLENKRNSPKDDAEGAFLAERPKIPEFERMKEHLAKGILASKSAPFLRWHDIKTAARIVDVERIRVIKKRGAIENLKFEELYLSPLQKQSEFLEQLMSINTFGGEQGRMSVTPKLSAFIDSIELPTIASSYFQSHNEIAAPTNTTKGVAARFQMIQTVKTRSFASLPDAIKGNREWFGLWDIADVSHSLTQPVMKNTLLRAGVDIHSEKTHLWQTYLEWGNDDGVMCDGYRGDGFEFGDSDPKIAKNYAVLSGNTDYTQPKKAWNKLMYFFTKTPLPQQTASVHVVKHKLNRAKTGFVAATEFHFDINSDGIPDFIVWEGTGIGPGHLDGPTKTDDEWYRIFFVNIAGHWHLLGTDTYSYGCGC